MLGNVRRHLKRHLFRTRRRNGQKNVLSHCIRYNSNLCDRMHHNRLYLLTRIRCSLDRLIHLLGGS
jgi:hypothetical protein